MPNEVKNHRDLFGSILGVLTFLGGVALLLLVFSLAYAMFRTPPQEALGVKSGKTLDLNQVGSNFAGIILRIGLLLLMGLVSSLVANRGISLYTASRAHRLHVEPAKPIEEGG